MEMKLQGTVLGCETQSLWDRRMLSGSRARGICSYYPDIGRGSIEHNTVSHEDVAKGLDRCARKSLWERLCAWFDV